MTKKKGEISLVFIGVAFVAAIVLAILREDTLSRGIAVGLAVISLCGGIFLYIKIVHPVKKLRKRITKFNPKKSVNDNKTVYLDIYELYLKMSEKNKRNFYVPITHIRDTVEEQLRAEKKMQQSLNQTVRGDITQQKEAYESAYSQYQKLPDATKQQYYAQVVHLREKLENGK
ncbi:hypothetical protein HOL21_00665 [Candidatus Woesearchaeota archaeon]|jgi:hypothetical protein|nr:hypothetical protein [Candidatus Woesearchaeota archaeon]MBT5396708.1 hypothetical protein [Candidatus Woesearchaeota archaeon]MBT5924324.1 hypothetical protein [Candidatus Woesearchaeota archaeon]MBT6367505.1 hypothetical protein [Candidatus Woesearchaeota archaeon]MBT7763004.1 hypothetical protein [Candidatus Woesearchaeota archaeon]